MRYWPVSQRPRSMSAQRVLQNGRAASFEGLPQTGQVGERLASDIAVLNDPFCCMQSGIGMQDQGTSNPTRKIRQCLAIRLERRDNRRGCAQRRQSMRGCRKFGCDAAQSVQPGGMRSCQQFMQRRMDARPDDLREAKRGKAEQARVKRIVGQCGLEGRREHGATAGRQAGKVDEDRAG